MLAILCVYECVLPACVSTHAGYFSGEIVLVFVCRECLHFAMGVDIIRKCCARVHEFLLNAIPISLY